MRKRCLAGVAAIVLAVGACDGGEKKFARVSVIESLDQAIGGPESTGREGDALLENDQIRVVIEQGSASRTFLGKGGTVVDVDLNRQQEEFRSGHGLDQMGQFVPVVNLYQADAFVPANVRPNVDNPEPTRSHEGAEVTVRAAGSAILPLVVGLGALLHQRYTDVPPSELQMYTEYEVRPGERMLRITTTFGFGIPACPVTEADGCNPECDDALYDSDCDCAAAAERCMEGVDIQPADTLPDRPFGGIFGVLLGDFPEDGSTCLTVDDCDAGEECVDVTQGLGGELRVCRGPEARDAGILLGDMLIFANETDAFFRGPGFDTESDIRRMFDAGFDTLQTPLELDAVYGVGDGVSYGYTSPDGSMLVPILSGPFSMGAPYAATCRTDQPGCLNGKLVRMERWLSVGEGDVSSAFEPIARARGVATGRVSGVVVASPSGESVSGAEVFAIADPRSLACDAACVDRCGDISGLGDDDIGKMSLDEVLEANRCRTVDNIFLAGKANIESMAVTDPVGDSRVDGGFTLVLPPGKYVLVARRGLNTSGHGVVEVRAGDTSSASFLLPEPARLDYAIFDETGEPAAGRITVGHCLPGAACADDGDCSGDTICQHGSCACERELPVPLEIHGGRQIDGVMAAEHARDGLGSIELPPGEYEVVFSRGPGYSIDEQVVTVQANRTNLVEGRIAKVIDRTGWVTSDFHVHAAPSLDSDLPMEDRIDGMICNDMDYFAATDHDTIVDYSPLVQDLGVRSKIGVAIGVEVSPVDLAHFIGFPLEYREWEDGQSVLGNGAPDWHNKPPGPIFDELRALEGDEGDVVVQIPHPYSYFGAYRVDPVSLEPTESFLSFINPLVDTSQFNGNWDALELMNSKNFDLIRRPTAGEVRFLSSRYDELRAAFRSGELSGTEYDRQLALLMTEAARRILHRTVDEQEAAVNGVGNELPCTCGADGDCAIGLVCDPSTLACVEPPLAPGTEPSPDNAMCRQQRGIVDDWFNMLNRGMRRTGLSGSDVHGEEAGTIRTFLRTGPVTTQNLRPSDITNAIRQHRGVVSTGPMIDFRVEEAEVGDMLDVSGGQTLELSVRVQKAPWYDIDRIEIYRNGRLIHWVNGCSSNRTGDADEPHDHGCMEAGEGVVAFEGTFTDEPEEDSWYAVTTFGVDGRSMSPVYRSVATASLGIGEVTQRLYNLVPLLRGFRSPRNAALFPMFPWAITNPIWVDIGGDGWTPPEPAPSWCRPDDFGC